MLLNVLVLYICLFQTPEEVGQRRVPKQKAGVLAEHGEQNLDAVPQLHCLFSFVLRLQALCQSLGSCRYDVQKEPCYYSAQPSSVEAIEAHVTSHVSPCAS